VVFLRLTARAAQVTPCAHLIGAPLRNIMAVGRTHPSRDFMHLPGASRRRPDRRKRATPRAVAPPPLPSRKPTGTEFACVPVMGLGLCCTPPILDAGVEASHGRTLSRPHRSGAAC